MIADHQGQPHPGRDCSASCRAGSRQRHNTTRPISSTVDCTGDDPRASPNSIPVNRADVTGVGELGLPDGLVFAQRRPWRRTGSNGPQAASRADGRPRPPVGPLVIGSSCPAKGFAALASSAPSTRPGERVEQPAARGADPADQHRHACVYLRKGGGSATDATSTATCSTSWCSRAATRWRPSGFSASCSRARDTCCG